MNWGVKIEKFLSTMEAPYFRKLLINGITLGLTLYGIYIAANEVTVITVIFAGLSTIGWSFGLLLELTVFFFENRRELFAEAFKADGAAIGGTIAKPVTVVSDFIKKATGRAEEEKPEPTKKQRLLEKLVAERKERKRAEREKKRQKAESERQEKLAKKEETKKPFAHK